MLVVVSGHNIFLYSEGDSIAFPFFGECRTIMHACPDRETNTIPVKTSSRATTLTGGSGCELMYDGKTRNRYYDFV